MPLDIGVRNAYSKTFRCHFSESHVHGFPDLIQSSSSKETNYSIACRHQRLVHMTGGSSLCLITAPLRTTTTLCMPQCHLQISQARISTICGNTERHTHPIQTSDHASHSNRIGNWRTGTLTTPGTATISFGHVAKAKTRQVSSIGIWNYSPKMENSLVSRCD